MIYKSVSTLDLLKEKVKTKTFDICELIKIRIIENKRKKLIKRRKE